MSGINDAVLYLITTLFDIYLFLLVVRVLLAYTGAGYFEPITQFIVRCTDFVVKPVRKIIPNVNHLEVSTLSIIVVLELLKFMLVSALSVGIYSVFGLIIMAVAESMRLFLMTFFYAIILQAILSWVQPGLSLNATLYRINAPILRPIQRVVPMVGGIDISPIPAMILLQLTIILIVNPLMAVGLGANLS